MPLDTIDIPDNTHRAAEIALLQLLQSAILHNLRVNGLDGPFCACGPFEGGEDVGLGDGEGGDVDVAVCGGGGVEEGVFDGEADGGERGCGPGVGAGVDEGAGLGGEVVAHEAGFHAAGVWGQRLYGEVGLAG